MSWWEIAQWALVLYGVLFVGLVRAFYVYRRRDDEAGRVHHGVGPKR